MKLANLFSSLLKKHQQSPRICTAILSPGTTFDIHSCLRFRRDIIECIKKAREIVIDMSQVSYVDSAGAATLLEMTRLSWEWDARLVLARTSASVMEMLGLYRAQDLEYFDSAQWKISISRVHSSETHLNVSAFRDEDKNTAIDAVPVAG